MTIDEAVKNAMSCVVSSYVTSEMVYNVTTQFHNGNNDMFVNVCKVIASRNIDVVDDCFENAYKIIFNIDHDGDSLDGNDAKTLIEYVRRIITSEVCAKKGRLMQAGVVFGIISKHS